MSDPQHSIDKPSEASPDEFELLARERQPGLVMEFLHFLRYNKKWWLTPILVVLLLLGILVALGGSPLAPLIYTVF